MGWPKWRLISANGSEFQDDEQWSRRRPDGQIDATFQRTQPRREGKPGKRESVMIVIEKDGLTRVYSGGGGGVIQSLKPHKRERLHRLACQAVAYYELTGSISGFPEQEFM